MLELRSRITRLLGNASTPPSVREAIRRQRGLTLVEIIVVLIILALLVTFLTSGIFGQGERAKARLNEMKMARVKGFLGEYQLQFNSLPPDLASLTGCAEGATNCAPIATPEDLKDAWGTTFLYTADANGNAFTLKSLGADRKEGGTGVDGDPVVTGP